MLRNEQAQRLTDYWRGVADERESLRRFAPLPPELPPRLPQSPSFEKLTNFSDLLALWEEEDRKKEQIERDEKAAFNKRYGYQP